MRILAINQFYPPDTAATGQLLADVVEELCAEGHEVHVLCSAGSYAGGRIRETPRHRRNGGPGIHRLGATGLGRARQVARLCDWGSYYLLAWEHSTRLGRFDACLSLTTPPFVGLVGVRLSRLWGTRFVLWVMDVYPQVAEATRTICPGGCVSRMLRALAGHIYDRADAIVSLGPMMTGRLGELGVAPDRIVDVPNWVPGEAVRPMDWGPTGFRDRLGLNGKFVVMYSGNMGLAHEFETIVSAADLLRDEEEVAFVFVGNGKRRRQIVEQAKRRGLDNVYFADPQPLKQLSALLASGCVHLVCMRRGLEGLLVPSKVYGILAAARPAILVGSTRNEVADLLTHSGAGLVVESGRADELAAAIRHLRRHRNVAAAMGRAGRSYYEKNLGRRRSVGAIVAAVTAQKHA